MIYYTGHGCENNGNWVCTKERDHDEEEKNDISLEEVLGIIERTGYKKRLTIICDCCFSGNWAY